MHPTTIMRSLILTTLVSLTTCAWAGGWEGREVMQDGIKHVINPAQPGEGSETMNARELWRLGGESEADEEMFGRVVSALMDEQENLYFLDAQLNEVKVFSSDGEYLRTIGQAGEGPGEFRNAMAQFLLPDGRIAVMQVMPTRIAVLDLAGNAMSDLALELATSSSMLMIQQIQSVGDRVIFSYIQPRITDERRVFLDKGLQVTDVSGKSLKTLKHESEEQDQGGGISISISDNDGEEFYRNWQLTTGGDLVIAPYYDRYQIWSLDTTSGEPVIIEREYRRSKRSREEIAELRERMRSDGDEHGGVQIEQEVPEYRRDITRLITRPNGEIWAVSGRADHERADDALPTFDVFDPRGRFVKQVTIKAEFNPDYDRFEIVGDRLIIFKEALSGGDVVNTSGGGGAQMVMIQRSGGGDEDDEREAEPFAIICYELPR